MVASATDQTMRPRNDVHSLLCRPARRQLRRLRSL
ncbi:hypothetical protein [Roseiflexus sp.]